MPRPQRGPGAWPARHPGWPTAGVPTAPGLAAALVLALLPGAQEPSCASWAPPVPGAVLRGFAPPATWLGPGHRGIDLAAAPGEPVTAVADGTVAFAGPIAGRGVLVLDHGSLRSTYEPVEALVRAGETVARGQPVGAIGSGGHCDGWCLHLGARVGSGRPASYRSPVALLACSPVLKPG